MRRSPGVCTGGWLCPPLSGYRASRGVSLLYSSLQSTIQWGPILIFGKQANRSTTCRIQCNAVSLPLEFDMLANFELVPHCLSRMASCIAVHSTDILRRGSTVLVVCFVCTSGVPFFVRRALVLYCIVFHALLILSRNQEKSAHVHAAHTNANNKCALPNVVHGAPAGGVCV